MKKHIIFFAIFLPILGISQNNIVRGVVKFKSSGMAAAEGITVGAYGANSKITDNFGMFELVYSSKKAGDKAEILIEPKDATGRIIRVVNQIVLDHERIPANKDERINVVICYEEDWRRESLSYYNLLSEKLELSFLEKNAALNKKLQDANNEKETIDSVYKQLEELQRQNSRARDELKAYSEFIANVDLDRASPLVKEAIKSIEENADIDKALSILDFEKLKSIGRLATQNRAKLKEEILKVIEGIELSINLLITKYQFDQAIEYEEEIIFLIKENNLNTDLLTKELSKLSSLYSDKGEYSKSMDMALEAIKNHQQKKTVNDSLLSYLYHQVSSCKGVLGQFEEALSYRGKSLDINIKIKDTLRIIGDYYGKAGLLEEMGALDSAIYYTEKSIELKNAFSDTSDFAIGVLNSYLSSLYFELGYKRKAFETSKVGLAILSKYLNKANANQLISIYSRVAEIARSRYDFQIALEAELRVQKIIDFISLPDYNIASIIAHLGKAETYRLLKNFQESDNYNEKAYSALQRDYPENHVLLSNHHTNKGDLFYDKKQYDQAEKEYIKAYKILQESISSKAYQLGEIYNKLGDVYASQNKYEEAVKRYEIAVQNYIDRPFINYWKLGKSYCNLGRALYFSSKPDSGIVLLRKGVEFLEKVLEWNDFDLTIPYANLAYVYDEQKNYQEAIVWHKKEIKILAYADSTNANYYTVRQMVNAQVALGKSYIKLGQLEDAERSYLEAHKIGHNNSQTNDSLRLESSGNLTQFYNSQNRFEEGFPYMKEVLVYMEKVSPDKVFPLIKAYELTINMSVHSEDKQDRKKLLRKLNQLNEAYYGGSSNELAKSLQELAETLVYEDSLEKASIYIDRAIAIQENIPNPDPKVLALSYDTKGRSIHYSKLDYRLERATEYYLKAIEVYEKNGLKNLYSASTYNNLSGILGRQNKYEEAINYQLKSISIAESRDNVEDLKSRYLDDRNNLYFDWAYQLFNQRNYNESLEKYNYIIDTLGFERFKNMRGLCHYYLGNHEKAISDYQDSQKAGGMSGFNYYNNIGMVYVKLKQYEEAKEAFEQCESLEPQNSRVSRNWAMYYGSQDDKELCLENILKAIEQGYNDLWWLENDSSLDLIRNDKRYKEKLKVLRDGE